MKVTKEKYLGRKVYLSRVKGYEIYWDGDTWCVMHKSSAWIKDYGSTLKELKEKG